MEETHYDTTDAAPAAPQAAPSRSTTRDGVAQRTRYQEVGARPGAAGRTVPNPDETRRWAQRCPLWQWRIYQRATRETAGNLLGVSDRTVARWEHGLSLPTSNHMAQLVDLLGPGTEDEWAEWMDRRPKVERSLLRDEAQRILAERRAREGLEEIDKAAADTARHLEELARKLADGGEGLEGEEDG